MPEDFGERTSTEPTASRMDPEHLEGETLPVEPSKVVPVLDHPGAFAPFTLGRYLITEQLGTGGFATVYKGYDEVLARAVAIKVPHQHRVTSPDAIGTWQTEGKALGSLDHPGIVPVYDVGQTDDGRPFLVSKLIEGEDLRTRLRRARPTRAAAVAIVVAIAEALHYAHQRGLVHRDVKPDNILIDADGRPYVADFGIALREGDLGMGPPFAGTPPYMSPEQARGEGHRVDARTDVYSLGVVFYELLTGHRPFPARDRAELLDQIKTREPGSPRDFDPTIPQELERICLKALSKRASYRYETALALAEDLLHFEAALLRHGPKEVETGEFLPAGQAAQVAQDGPLTESTGHFPARTSYSGSWTGQVIPRGLRAFDAADANFFLDLLPGPRDRNGLPESVRFWKIRIEDAGPDDPFTVGLLYGPSGCGKSSLVKAGLLPCLASHVTSVYVDATAGEMEARVLKNLRQRCPRLPGDLGLVQSLAWLRRSKGQDLGAKVLLVFDQFEQWLHATQKEPAGELVEALRQCDGRHIQCLILVRDDFWIAISRFMRDLEVPLIEGHNSCMVDLFDPLHARHVLAEFGRAFRRLPSRPELLAPEHERFLDQAVAGLAQHGKIIPVRLSLFAEMLRGRPWVPATLQAVGGIEGIGVIFLEEMLGDRAARPEYRLHQKAARAVLQALLPEQGMDIKGSWQSRQRLLEAAEYARRPQDFDTLLRILDNELRLITPSEAVVGDAWSAEGKENDDGSKLPAIGRVAVRDGSGGEVLPGHKGLPQRRTVRPGQPDPASGSVNPGKHRRGSGEGPHQGVSQSPEHRARIADGVGNAPDAKPENWSAAPNATGQPADTNRPHQPDVERPAQSPSQESQSLSPATRHQAPATRYYQLTHDYLVPTLREWLTRKQRETRRGCAELCLRERADLWNVRPASRYLPSALEWWRILLYSRRRDWTASQRKMMGAATRKYLVRLTAAVFLLCLLGWGAWEGRGYVRASTQVRVLAAADTTDSPEIIRSLDGYRRWADPMLQRLATESGPDSRERLNASLALLPVDEHQREYLLDRLLRASPQELPIIRDALAANLGDRSWPEMPAHHGESPVATRLWKVLDAGSSSPLHRFNAGIALAELDPPLSPPGRPKQGQAMWQQHAGFLVNRLVSEVRANPSSYAALEKSLRPARLVLVPALGVIFRDRGRPDYDRLLATTLLADYAADMPETLADLVMDSDADQYAVLLPKLIAYPDQALIARLMQNCREKASLMRVMPPEKPWPSARPLVQSPYCTWATKT